MSLSMKKSARKFIYQWIYWISLCWLKLLNFIIWNFWIIYLIFFSLFCWWSGFRPNFKCLPIEPFCVRNNLGSVNRFNPILCTLHSVLKIDSRHLLEPFSQLSILRNNSILTTLHYSTIVNLVIAFTILSIHRLTKMFPQSIGK